VAARSTTDLAFGRKPRVSNQTPISGINKRETDRCRPMASSSAAIAWPRHSERQRGGIDPTLEIRPLDVVAVLLDPDAGGAFAGFHQRHGRWWLHGRLQDLPWARTSQGMAKRLLQSFPKY
jgi:hypothetical protein